MTKRPLPYIPEQLSIPPPPHTHTRTLRCCTHSVVDTEVSYNLRTDERLRSKAAYETRFHHIYFTGH